MTGPDLSGAQLRALRELADAPLGFVRLSESFHGTPDGETRVLSRVLQGLERRGLVEWREIAGGWRAVATDAAREFLYDLEQASAVLEAQLDLFAEGGAA